MKRFSVINLIIYLLVCGLTGCSDIKSSLSGRSSQNDVSGTTRNLSSVLFDSNWRFLKADAPGAEFPDFDDTTWRLLGLPPDGVVRAFTVPDIANLSKTYFVSLTLEDKSGAVLSRNFYWLSTVKDVLDSTKRKWYITPTSVHGDFTSLATLPSVNLDIKTNFVHDGANDRALVTLTNPGTSLAFFVRLRVLQSPSGAEILPSMWSDNYVSLLPGETRTLTARWRSDDAPGATPTVVVDGWNVVRK